MRTFKTPLALLLMTLLFLTSCSKDENEIVDPVVIDPCENPCNNPAKCPDQCDQGTDSEFSQDNIVAEGEIIETEDGYLVDGTLIIETDSIGSIVFDNADLDVSFNDDGSLAGMSGTVEVPSPSNYFEFTDPIQADIGFFTGKYLNENRDFEILLVDDVSYFVYNIAVTVELKIGANDDPDAHKPLSIKPPVGGHITFIADYNDPMYFFSVGQDLLGNGSVGASFGGNIPYVPIQPVDNIISFGAKSVRGGSFSFWKVLSASGMFYENKEVSADINFEEPLETNFGIGYKAGINSELEMSLPVSSFISLDFPIGQGSAAFVAEATTNNGVIAKAFINGLVDPDASWWPNFIPLKPDGKLNAYGYVEQTGRFDIGLSGEFGIEMPGETQKAEGALRVTHEAFTMEGKVTKGDEVWGAKATFAKDKTEYIASPPEGFLDGVSDIVTHKVDSTFAVSEKALEDFKKAAENYELELSLRGLRDVLPGIVNKALEIIDESVDAGIADGRSQADSYLSDYNRALCSDNIESVVEGIVKPYKDALIRLRNAVNNTNDNEQTRIEIEAALRSLAALKRIDKSANVSITHGNKAVMGTNPITGDKFTIIPKCTEKGTVTRNVSIKRDVLTTEQVNQLLEAADNVKYIEEASNIKIEAQLIVDQLPSVEDLENLKNNINGCVSEITDNIGDVGFSKNHDTGEYTYFMMVNGERTEVSGFNIFDSSSVIDIAMPEFSNCNVDEELKRLQKTFK